MNDQEQVELPLLKSARASVVFVDNHELLNEAVAVLANATGPFALDAERASGFKYSQRAYLIQVHRSETPIYLIDPIAISPEFSTEPFKELAALLAQDEWVLHAASQDIPCLSELGFSPVSLFDTELGSRIAGLPRVSLGAVCEHFLSLRLAKEHSAVDWSTRPLLADWLNYAALDVDVLLELRDKLEVELETLGKLDWARQEFANTARMKAKPPKADKWRSLTGLSALKDARKYAVAKAMWEARELLAIKLDVSPGRLIPDSAIVHVANTLPKSRPELAGDRAFVGRASRSYIDTWWTAVENGLKSRDLPPIKVKTEGIPNHRTWPGRFTDADNRLKAVKPVLQELSESLKIPAENLITPDFVRQVCWEPPVEASANAIGDFLASLGARQWQIDLVAEPIHLAISAAGQLVED